MWAKDICLGTFQTTMRPYFQGDRSRSIVTDDQKKCLRDNRVSEDSINYICDTLDILDRNPGGVRTDSVIKACRQEAPDSDEKELRRHFEGGDYRSVEGKPIATVHLANIFVSKCDPDPPV